MTTAAHPDLAGALDAHRRLLWAIAYRMTGVAADADDIVQETFARALTKPPSLDRPVRPWLVTVAMNLARDALRRRRRARYHGPWLPSPVDDDQLDVPELERIADDRAGPEQRYGIRESATFAFLIALERLTPQRRAVLILRDVFDSSTEEAARALGMTTDAVKQSLLRARRALASYDSTREPLGVKRARDEQALGKLFVAITSGDVAAVEGLLAHDVEAHSDGGGEFVAAKAVIHGAAKVALVYTNLVRLSVPTGFEVRALNGGPAAVVDLVPAAHMSTQVTSKLAPRAVLRVDTNVRGEIVRVHAVMTTRKLTAI